MLAFFQPEGELAFFYRYSDGTSSESDVLPLTAREARDVENIRNIYNNRHKYIDSIGTSEYQVVFNITAYHSIHWFPNGKAPEKLRSCAKENHYKLRRVHLLTPRLYIFYLDHREFLSESGS